jgi:hypothetical protein
MQGWCTVCVERTTGSKIVLDSPDGILGGVVKWNLASFCLETVLVLVQDGCMVCTRRAKGSEIILDGLDGTTR